MLFAESVSSSTRMVYFLGGPTCGSSPASGRGTKNLLSTTTGEQDQELVQKSAVFVRNTLCIHERRRDSKCEELVAKWFVENETLLNFV